jgi:protein-S-isoprenylcysteine O-methyltransferase Ste14
MSSFLLRDPWFWAFWGAIGWGLGIGVVGTRTPGRRLWFGIVMFVLAEFPRAILPLPFVIQPRIDPTPWWLVALGGLVLAAGLAFAAPMFRIVPLTAPDRGEPLRTGGLYAVVRHPLMVCDILWPLGLSLIFGSTIGILLVPAWLLMIWMLTHVEEESLVREYGDAYRVYQARVPRFLPRLAGFFHGRQPRS